MRIIVGHTNMDLDCLGSMALARLMFPGSRAVGSRLIHPVARNLFHLYADHFDFLSLEELTGETVEEMVIVDTRSRGRVKEFLQAITPLPGVVEVWDHHPADASDIPGAVVHEAPVGSNTTLLGMEVRKRGIRPGPEDATIALTGIYADTGNFTHENVTSADFEIAGWLKGLGASLTLVKSFLQTLKDESQVTLFHELLNKLTYQTVHGSSSMWRIPMPFSRFSSSGERTRRSSWRAASGAASTLPASSASSGAAVTRRLPPRC
ncbi:MAG: DHH family phosphoesterase [Spirochaetia bacterium]